MSSNKQPVLSVRGLKKIYLGHKPFLAVDDISFDLKPGEILGLLGPNGAGKTTTIQMLMGTLTPSSGSIEYFGLDFVKHRSEILKKVVFASTYVSLPWNLTVKQNLEVFGRLYGMTGEKLNTRRDMLLERFGIEKKKKDSVASLSSGQITRLMLVKAFMIEPKIVLLDEPTASLDPDIAKDVCQFVLEQREKEGVSILFTSHNLSEVAEVCDRVLFLRGGKIIADDIPEKLARSAGVSTIQLIVGDGLKRTMGIADLLSLPYKLEHRSIELKLDEGQIAEFLHALAKAGVMYTNINIFQPTLEDYFLQVAAQAKEEEHL
jgi:ABC-2 type transport system ATP-binding protein